MTLKEKFDCVVYNEYGIDIKQCELIAEEFAIGFAEWIDFIRVHDNGLYSLNSYEELLEIYKKENQL